MPDIFAENTRRRHCEEAADAAYNPLHDAPHNDPAAERERCREDFEYWAARCVRIKDKRSGRLVPFRLNCPQRRVAAMLEEDRRANRPIRLIMLKARQWGGSTLIQHYMAWIQCCRAEYWHSLLCAQNHATASAIRGMYTQLLVNYPEELWEGEPGVKRELRRYEGMDSIREITGRHCRVILGSAESQDAVRGQDYAMAHLSEVAFWKKTPQMDPVDFMRSICGAIASEPLTLIALESTANGVGNFFHTEWLRAERGESGYRAVFVPWTEIEYCQVPPLTPSEAQTAYAAMDDYEQRLWEHGVTLERIAWYQQRRRLMPTRSALMAEYPTTPSEAFTNTASNVFAAEHLERLRLGCQAPIATGDVQATVFDAEGRPTRAVPPLTGRAALQGVHFVDAPNGLLKVWEKPGAQGRYVCAVDIGGRCATADFSVIAVLRLGAMPTVVAQWRGHTDHDLLAFKAAQIATLYNQALLVFESNTLESENPLSAATGGIAGGEGACLLHALGRCYRNLYRRAAHGPVMQAEGIAPAGNRLVPGFHTNRATKRVIIAQLIAAVRDGLYTERCAEAVDEMACYEALPNGVYAARPGRHDDILMTRAIALHVAAEAPTTLGSTSSSDEDDAFLNR